MRRVVVLPHPEGPNRVTNSPGAMTVETWSTPTTSLPLWGSRKIFVTPSISTPLEGVPPEIFCGASSQAFVRSTIVFTLPNVSDTPEFFPAISSAFRRGPLPADKSSSAGNGQRPRVFVRWTFLGTSNRSRPKVASTMRMSAVANTLARPNRKFSEKL